MLSHFHPDHTGNLEKIDYDNLYTGAFTKKRLGDKAKNASVITAPISFENEGENSIKLFPIPSSHAKGCLGLLFENYAFLGDAVYSASKNGKSFYNAGLLKELILTLKNLDAEYFLLSHNSPFVRLKSDVTDELEKIYALKKRGEAFIELDDN